MAVPTVMRWPVTISEVANGYVVKVGCQYLVFTDLLNMLDELRAYGEGSDTVLAKRIKQEAGVRAECPEPPRLDYAMAQSDGPAMPV